MLSIIIPVYNCEKYIGNCIESILDQSYRELELIIVDDGSLDNSGNICEEYSLRDARVKVIHKVNQGVNLARQEAVQHAIGDLLMFVDADDYLESNIIENCIRAYNMNKAEIICFNYCCNGKKGFHITEEINLNRNEAVEQILMKQYLDGNLWCKIYHKKLFDAIKFPKPERNLDDFLVVNEVFQKVENIVVLPLIGYHYRIVEGGISHGKFKESILFYVESTYRYKKFIENKYPNLSRKALLFHLEAVIWVLGKMEKDVLISRNSAEYLKLKKQLKGYSIVILMNPNFCYRDKINYLLIRLKIYRTLYVFYEKTKKYNLKKSFFNDLFECTVKKEDEKKNEKI